MFNFIGEPCELIKSTNSFPGIVVHPCADVADQTDHHGNRKYIPTKRPAYDFWILLNYYLYTIRVRLNLFFFFFL